MSWNGYTKCGWTQVQHRVHRRQYRHIQVWISSFLNCNSVYFRGHSPYARNHFMDENAPKKEIHYDGPLRWFDRSEMAVSPDCSHLRGGMREIWLLLGHMCFERLIRSIGISLLSVVAGIWLSLACSPLHSPGQICLEFLGRNHTLMNVRPERFNGSFACRTLPAWDGVSQSIPALACTSVLTLTVLRLKPLGFAWCCVWIE